MLVYFTKLIWLVSISVQIFLLLQAKAAGCSLLFANRHNHCWFFAWMLGIKSRIMSRSLNNYAKNLPKFIRNYEVFIEKISFGCWQLQVVCDQLIDEGVAREKVLLIYNGYEPKRKKLRRIKKRRSIVGKSPYAFISVANLIPYKGHRDLLEAIRLLPTELDFTVTLVGGGKQSIPRGVAGDGLKI